MGWRMNLVMRKWVWRCLVMASGVVNQMCRPQLIDRVIYHFPINQMTLHLTVINQMTLHLTVINR